MVTIVIGKKNNTNLCKIKTLSESSDKPQFVQFPVTEKEHIKCGNPKWANYVKGVIRYFEGRFIYLFKFST